MSTIPGSLFVAVTPSVLPAAGEQQDVQTVVGTASARVPIGQVYSFANGTAVTNFFGSGSAEDVVANGGAGKGSGYFGGFTGSDKTPGAILFAQYNQAAVAAYLWAKRLLPVITGNDRSELLFRLTDLAFAQGDNDLARKTLSELLEKHPYSQEAAQAKEKWAGKE